MFRTPSATFRPDPARARELAEFLRRAGAPRTDVALTLGTGMHDLAASMIVEREIPFANLPGFPTATAPSHRGVIQWGFWHGVPAIVFVGRLHLYEGCAPAAVTLTCAAAQATGARAFVLTNAAGGLRGDMHVGDLMALDDHLNGQSVLASRSWADCGADVSDLPPRFGHERIYSEELVERAFLAAGRVGTALHRGVYLGVPGPTYETRAEYRAFRRIGADAVGMSTTLEASAARLCGMHVLGFSMITNVARPDVVQTVAGDEVIAAAKEGVPRLRAVLDELFLARAFDRLLAMP